MKLSVIIPVKDEETSLPILYKELKDVIPAVSSSYEIVFIDDGSADDSWRVLTRLASRDKNIKLVKFRANFGKSAALDSGLNEVTGDVVVMLDADLQDDPAEIPRLIKKLKEEFDFVIGWRKNRNDTLSKRISSMLFNKGTAFISGVPLHDFNSGLKAFTREVARELEIRGELHRFIPVLAAKNKFKVTEIPVHHRPRKFGTSKYGFGRSWRGIIDLLTTIFLTGYSTKPAHFFAKIGIPLFIVGFTLDAYVTYLKLTTGSTQGKIPLLLAGVLCIMVGIQLVSTGLIGEMFISTNRDKHQPHRLS